MNKERRKQNKKTKQKKKLWCSVKLWWDKFCAFFIWCLALLYWSLLFKCLVRISMRSRSTGEIPKLLVIQPALWSLLLPVLLFDSCGISSVLKLRCRCLKLESNECCYFSLFGKQKCTSDNFCLWLPLLQRVLSSMKAFEIFRTKETWELFCMHQINRCLSFQTEGENHMLPPKSLTRQAHNALHLTNVQQEK